MPNPNRPQYQDTIEETWGQAVADTVVRRYASTADRDADLAGFSPAELAGQVVVVLRGAGLPPQVHTHDGAAWRVLGEPFIIAAELGVTVDAWGNWNVDLPAGARLVAATAVGAQEGLSIHMVRHTTNGPTFGTRVSFRSYFTNSATNPVNTTIGAAYIAAVTY
jgi:hypothetical protein